MSNSTPPKPAQDLYYEALGASFDEWMSAYDVERRVQLIQGLLPAEAARLTCLEVGCGTGKIAAALVPLLGSYTVSDISESLAEAAGQRLGVDWSQQDACNLTYPEASFDLVISSECIEHTPDPQRALAEMARVVRPGGFLIITSPNRLWHPLLRLSIRLGIRKYSGVENWLFPGQAIKALKDNSIVEILASGCHLFPWQLPLAKRLLPALDRFGPRLYPLMINYALRGRKK